MFKGGSHVDQHYFAVEALVVLIVSVVLKLLLTYANDRVDLCF